MMALTRQKYRWVMLVLIWLVYLSFGLVIGAFAALITPVVIDLSLSYSQMGLVLGAYQLFLIGSSIFAGNLLDRWASASL